MTRATDAQVKKWISEESTGLHVHHLKAVAARHGGTVVCESSGDWCVWQCEPPEGQLWSCADLQALRVQWMRGDTGWRSNAIKDAIERMEYGTHPMEDDEEGNHVCDDDCRFATTTAGVTDARVAEPNTTTNLARSIAHVNH